ncbi:MAG: hypothetical protein ACEY3L_09285 [Wolbachia sp.]
MLAPRRYRSRYLLAAEIPRMNRGMTVRGGMMVRGGMTISLVIPLLVSG